MFGWRRDKKKKNRIDEMANRLAQAGRVADIAAGLARFDPRSLKGVELESWHHLHGIEAFRRGDRRAAFRRFQQGRLACPDSGQIAFSLGQEHEYRAEPEQMFALFDAYKFPTVPASHALAQARYAYLWSDLTRAQSYIAPIFDVYWNLGIADDTFLYLRGLPFFSQSWAYSAAFRELTGHLDDLERETREAGSRLTDYDVAAELKLVRAIRANDFADYVREPRRGTAYERTRAAVLLANEARSLAEAAAFLDEVTLDENDFPWLADVLLLAKCAAAARLNDPMEESLVEAFLGKQALLFEPDHAFNFRLLRYQERLTLRFQALRRARAAQPGVAG